MNKLDRLKLRVLHELPYFHSFLSQCNVFFSKDSKCGTAYIGIKKNGTINIGINEKYFDEIGETYAMGGLQHEILHLIFGHLNRYDNIDPKYHSLLNVAKDMAINQVIEAKYVKETWIYPERFGLEKNLTTEEYFLKLLKDAEKYKNETPQDNHDIFYSEVNGKISEAIIKEVAYKAYSKNYGNMPANLKKLLEEFITPSVIPWQTILRRFIGLNLSFITETTRTRPNRRLGLKASGLKKEYLPKILGFQDQSGSISEECLTKFNSELVAILKSIQVSVHCYAFDTEVEYLGEITHVNKIKNERVKNGGTSFVPIFEEASKNEADVIIIFTDGYGTLPPELPKKPILWVLDHDNDLNLPGTILRMKQ